VYSKWEDFYAELKDSLNFYFTYLDKRDLIHLEARACLVLLQKLVEENDIFTFIEPPKTTKASKSGAKTSKPEVIKPAPTIARQEDPKNGRVTRAQLGKTFNIKANVKDAESSGDEYYEEEEGEDEKEESKQGGGNKETEFEVSID
jgi:hypothetical protein